MYAIYAYIDPPNHPNVSIYGIHGVSGFGCVFARILPNGWIHLAPSHRPLPDLAGLWMFVQRTSVHVLAFVPIELDVFREVQPFTST